MSHSAIDNSPCRIIILGASGDLCQRKLLPALFSLYCSDMLPDAFAIFGFARTTMTDEAFRKVATRNLTCRYEPEASRCAERMEGFLSRCFYYAGSYDDPEAFRGVARRSAELLPPANTLAYMAVPPNVYTPAANAMAAAGLVEQHDGRWFRAVLEKPFGRDSESSAALSRQLRQSLSSDQTYRIDHYLGKEVVQNLMVLRFANIIFEPLWNRTHIERVEIAWSEQIGCEGRAGYFDHYGIIRDVVQNHLLQIVALVGMESPIALTPQAITDEKVRVLRCIRTPTLRDVLTGQYVGYSQEPGVPEGSHTETYARANLWIDNPRWHGVPFRIEAGKALDTQRTEIQIHFRDVPYSVFHGDRALAANRLVIRVQPDEAIELHVVNKHPGLGMRLETADLNLFYQDAFKTVMPEAYERLLLDVLRGDRSLFLGDRELAACWDVVTPVLKQLEAEQVTPLPYAFGSAGPAAP